MKDWTLEKSWRVAGFVLGGMMILIGILGLTIEASKSMPGAKNVYGYAFGLVLLACGAIICIGLRSRYRGGVWSFAGLLLVAAGMIRLALLLEVWLGARHLVSSVSFFSTLAALWIVGFYCLFWGHMRRHRERL